MAPPAANVNRFNEREEISKNEDADTYKDNPWVTERGRELVQLGQLTRDASSKISHSPNTSEQKT